LNKPTLHLIGSGLRGIRSLTVEEDKILKTCEVIFVDSYTSIFPDSFLADLKNAYNGKIISLKREEIESFYFLKQTKDEVALIVSGDPFTSTTHFSLMKFASENGIKVLVYENASIVSVIPGRTGLSSYRCGTVVSIPEIYDNFVPRSPLKKIIDNLKNNLHTILLLDLKDGQNLKPERVFSIFIKMSKFIDFPHLLNLPILLLERVGWADERVSSLTLKELDNINANSPYVLVLCSSLDQYEIENMESRRIDTNIFKNFNYEQLFQK
jgi:diphthine synthase